MTRLPGEPPDPAAVEEEARRARRLQRAVDITLALIRTSPGLTVTQAVTLAEAARSIAEDLFPDRGEMFDLLYRPRLLRAIAERFPPSGQPAP